MSTFQLDQCISSHAIVEACRQEGHGDAIMLPNNLRNTKDPQLVPIVMAGTSVFVTKDWNLPTECASLIPSNSRRGLNSLKTRRLRKQFS